MIVDAAKTGKVIRDLRTEKGMTQQELASLLNVSPTTVSKWENGRGLPDVSMLEPLTKVFEVSFAEIILGESGQPKEEAAAEPILSTEEKTEAAIKSVIEESIVQKEKKYHKRVVAVSVTMLFLSVVLVLLGWWVHAHEEPWSRNLSRLERVDRQGAEDPFYQGGKWYYPYKQINSEIYKAVMRELDPRSSNPGAGAGTVGEVVAYSLSQDSSACYYYSTMRRMSGDWLLMFRDDGNGWPNADNALYLYGTEQSITNAPYWLTKIR